MDTLLIILTIAIVVTTVLLVFQMKANQTKSQGVNIHTDENSSIHVSTSGNTLQIQITYESTENRPSDAFLFPDPEPLLPPAGSLDRSFWLKVAAYDDLSKEEKNEIDERLAQSGFFRREETSVASVMQDDEEEMKYVEMIDNFVNEDLEPEYNDENTEPQVQTMLSGFSPEITW